MARINHQKKDLKMKKFLLPLLAFIAIVGSAPAQAQPFSNGFAPAIHLQHAVQLPSGLVVDSATHPRLEFMNRAIRISANPFPPFLLCYSPLDTASFRRWGCAASIDTNTARNWPAMEVYGLSVYAGVLTAKYPRVVVDTSH